MVEILNALDWTYRALGAERHEQSAQLRDCEAVSQPRLVDTSLLVADGQPQQAVIRRTHERALR